jgi:site-specific DNA recombinase
MLASFAQFGSDQLSEVMRDRLTNKAKAGLWVGPVPLGYVRVRPGWIIPTTQATWSADHPPDCGPQPYDAEAVRLISELYTTRIYSFTNLADELNRRGYRTLDWRTGARGHFGREGIRTILRNPAYIGKVSSGGQCYDGKHEPLWSLTTWEAIQAILQERTIQRTTRDATHERGERWLTGLLYCEACGGKLWHLYGGRRGQLRYVRCSGWSRRECEAKQVRVEQLEQQLLDLLGELSLPEELLAVVVDEAQRLLTAQNTPAQPAIDPSTIHAKLRRLGLVWADGLIGDGEYEAEKVRLKAMLAEVQSTRRGCS